MGFWGIEVKPGDPYPYHSDNVPGVLHVTQATLGDGSAKERSVVKCSIGHKSPIFLCALLPGKTESCSLNLEFGEDELIAFSVTGPRSIHLSGFFEAFEEEDDGDDYEADSYGEDVSASESDSLGFNTSDEYADEFSDDEDAKGDDFDMCQSSPVRKSGVVIEEIEDDEKPVKENGQSKQLKKKKKKNQSRSKDSTSSEKQIVVRGESGVPILESEDEDGFPISTKRTSDLDVQNPKEDAKSTDEKSAKNKKTQDSDVATNLKRKVENTEKEGRQEKKKNKKLKEQGGDESKSNDEHVEKKADEKSVDDEMTQVSGKSQPEEKKKKNKKNKKKGKEIEEQKQTNPEQTVTATAEKKKKTSETTAGKEKSNAKSSKVRNYPNGLAIEELLMGRPDGKRATPGKSVSVHYIGKLVKTGQIFDSNIGKAPFKFRLGTAQVISGWDIGVNGMHVGDKRRITIPPEMGYGSRGAGKKIPPNSWLTFDVELVNVS